MTWLALLAPLAAHAQSDRWAGTITVRVTDDLGPGDQSWAVEAWRRTVARHERATARAVRRGEPPPPAPTMTLPRADGYSLPIHGAWVRAEGVIQRTCRTDDDGTCALGGLTPGSYTLTAAMKTCGEVAVDLEIPAGSEVTLPIALHCEAECSAGPSLRDGDHQIELGLPGVVGLVGHGAGQVHVEAVEGRGDRGILLVVP